MNNSNYKNIIRVSFGNAVALISGVAVGFFLPKIISVDDYGYYKIYALYAPYFTLLNLGLIDGIGLKYGDREYDELNREDFRAYFRWYIIIHLVFLAILVPITLKCLRGEYKFIFIMLELNLIAVNVTGYLQHISQITQRFKEFSYRKIVSAILNILLIGVMMILYLKGNDTSYRYYIILIAISNVILMIWYCYTYRDIIIGIRSPLKQTFYECVEFVKTGFPLLLSYQIVTLILSLDRQFVSLLFHHSTYATYSFAYSMMSIITIATSAMTAVIFPMLKRIDKEKLLDGYSTNISYVMIVVFALIGIYFPLTAFIQWFLPKYSDSIEIFRIIIPGIAISSSITVVMHNYYKVLGISKHYFTLSILILGISAAANAISYITFHTTQSISIASVIVILIWYFVAEKRIRRYDKTKNYKHDIYLLIMIALFYLCSYLFPWNTGCAIYVLVYIILTLYFFKSLIRGVVNKENT